MSNRTIYTRVYSPRSAGKLTSGRAPTGPPLSYDQLLAEFPSHADAENRTPTPFVSVSNRIVDTVQRAFKKRKFGESPADIWVVFIEVPAGTDHTSARLYSARELAIQCVRRGRPELSKVQDKMKYEFVFEWGIPEDYILHQVSLETLIDRGLRFQASSTVDLRDSFARQFFENCPFEIGFTLGLFAQPFGPRAPLQWIAHQLYYDCVRTKVYWDSQMVDLDHDPYGQQGHSERVEFEFFCWLDQGVETALMMDSWLADDDFAYDYREFEIWRNALKCCSEQHGVGH